MIMTVANYEGKRSKTWDRRISLHANEETVRSLFPDLRCDVGLASNEEGLRKILLTPSKHGRKWAQDRDDTMLLTIPHNEKFPLFRRTDVKVSVKGRSLFVPMPKNPKPPISRGIARRRGAALIGSSKETIIIRDAPSRLYDDDAEGLVMALNTLAARTGRRLWIDHRGKLRLTSPE